MILVQKMETNLFCREKNNTPKIRGCSDGGSEGDLEMLIVPAVQAHGHIEDQVGACPVTNYTTSELRRTPPSCYHI